MRSSQIDKQTDRRVCVCVCSVVVIMYSLQTSPVSQVVPDLQLPLSSPAQLPPAFSSGER